MDSKEIYIFGAGGHAKVVATTVKSAGFDIPCFFDDNEKLWGSLIYGVPTIGPCRKVHKYPPRSSIIAVGDNLHRYALAVDLNLAWQAVIDPRAYVHPSVACGEGTVVFPGAIVQIDSCLGKHVIVNNSASIDHDCRLGDFVHVAPGVCLAGNVQIGNGAFVGIGAAVIPGVKIGAGAIIGAGAVVIRDVPENAVVIGVPGRIHSIRSDSAFSKK
ncbi:MAG: NeuD/PglB/VioB family sugar acetyltransferase [Thermoguttaceae bacterium]